MTRIILNTPWITDPRLNPIEIYIGKDRHRKKIYDRKNIETKKTLKTEWCRGEEDYFHVIEMLQEIYSIGGSAFVKGDSNGDLIWLYQGYSVQYLKAFVYLLESTGRVNKMKGPQWAQILQNTFVNLELSGDYFKPSALRAMENSKYLDAFENILR